MKYSIMKGTGIYDITFIAMKFDIENLLIFNGPADPEIEYLEGRIKNIKNAQLLSYFLHNKGCDVVVSLVAPQRELREEFKIACGDSIVEFYVHTNRKRQREQYKVDNYQAPEEKFFDVDTTSETPIQSFTRLIHYLRETEKI